MLYYNLTFQRTGEDCKDNHVPDGVYKFWIPYTLR